MFRRAAFDVFLSYRVSADNTTADRLRDKLSAAGLTVWYDRRSLAVGTNWQRAFIDGLTRSSVYVPLLSVDALKPMEDLTAETEWPDNLLLEMRIALELADALEQRGQPFSICPVFIGPPSAHASYTPLYLDNFFYEAARLKLCPVRAAAHRRALSVAQPAQTLTLPPTLSLPLSRSSRSPTLSRARVGQEPVAAVEEIVEESLARTLSTMHNAHSGGRPSTASSPSPGSAPAPAAASARGVAATVGRLQQYACAPHACPMPMPFTRVSTSCVPFVVPLNEIPT